MCGTWAVPRGRPSLFARRLAGHPPRAHPGLVCPNDTLGPPREGWPFFVSGWAVPAVHEKPVPLLPEALEPELGRPDQGLGGGRAPPDAPAPGEVREAFGEHLLGHDDRGLERREAPAAGRDGSGHGGILRRPHAQRPDASPVTVGPARARARSNNLLDLELIDGRPRAPAGAT